jgi:hypothetical protein
VQRSSTCFRIYSASQKEKTAILQAVVCIGDPNSIDLISFGRTGAHSLCSPAFFHPPLACSAPLCKQSLLLVRTTKCCFKQVFATLREVSNSLYKFKSSRLRHLKYKNTHFRVLLYFTGETTATNLELFLVPDYYLATLERYEEIIKAKLL